MEGSNELARCLENPGRFNYYANAVVWDAVYGMAGPELKEAMDLVYLTGQRPADVIIMRSDDTEGDYFLVTQGKTGHKLRISMQTESGENSLGKLVREITERNANHLSKYLLINKYGKKDDERYVAPTLGQGKQEITKRVYRRIGATAKPSK
ncbi:site-specific integrase [Pseudomonas extremorientalis]